MFERFTEKAIKVIMLAQEEARRLGHNFVGTEQILLGLIGEGTGVAAKVLKSMGVNLKDARIEVEKIIGRGSGFVAVEIPFTPRAKRVLELSLEEARQLGHNYIGTEHLLLGLIREGEGVAARVLENLGVDLSKVRTQVIRMLGETAEVSSGGGQGRTKTPTLDEFGSNLTQMAGEGKLDPVVGRQKEIERVIQILGRRTKNNPVLIGEPGVGKTAIAEGLAQRIMNGDIPDILEEKRVVTLDIGLLVAGTKYRGEFEDRLRSVLHEVTESDGQVVLFIDELHTVVGAGAGQGTMDAGNLLKPMLARGELRCIGATTLDEYRKHIEKDAALERRFQQVYVEQPTADDTISILRGLKERYEVHHGVKIADSALVAAAVLSDRYISDRFLPDKAIDLVDEAAAKLKMEITSKPEELEVIDRRLMQLQMEQLSLESEDASSGTAYRTAQERLARIIEEIEELSERQQQFSGQWHIEKQTIEAINALKEEEEQLRLQVDQAERAYDLNKAAQLKYGKLEAVQRDLEAKEAHLLEIQAQGKTLLREQVLETDIAEVVAKWTGIPVNRLMESERQKLLRLEGHLHERVIGQEEAVTAVAAAIRRARAGMNDPGRPLGSFLFMGPTGVGKTELARALAAFLFDTEEALIRIDMSEYMEKHAVARLVGAPPGYVGYEEGGQLSESVRRHPYSVVLLDEVEKAHPDVFNILLQVLDDGRITDSQGHLVDFSNTIVIMTSNIGSDHILDVAGDDSRYDEMRDRVLKALRSHFRPEFLNRVDDLILFHALLQEQLRAIVSIQIQRIEKRLADQKLSLSLSKAAIDHIAQVGYDPVYGARPLKRAIQKELENPIATKILEEAFPEGSLVQVSLQSGKLVFACRQDKTAVVATDEAAVSVKG